MTIKVETMGTCVSELHSVTDSEKKETKGQNLFEDSIFFGIGKKIKKYDRILFRGSALATLCGELVQQSFVRNMGLAGIALAYGIAAFHNSYSQNLFRKMKLDLSETKSDKEGEEYKDTSVIVIDDFNKKDVETLGIPHGKLVQKYITENLPGVNVYRCHLNMNENNNDSYVDIICILKDILNDIKRGKKYDAINMSIGLLMGVEIKDLYVDDNGKKVRITKDNMKQYKTKLRDTFIKNMYDNKSKRERELGMPLDTAFEQCDEIRSLLKEIGDKGVKIFLANNNFSKYSITYSDLFDIDEDYEDANNPNIITISSSDDEIKSFPISDVKESSNYEFKKARDGIDITDDGIADIILDDSCLDAMYYAGIDKLTGNSFGTPTTLAKYIQEKHNKKEIEE